MIGKNIFDKKNYINGFYVHQETGEILPNNVHKCTSYIEITPNTKYIANQSLQRYAFYDANKKFVQGGMSPFGWHIQSPINAKYLVASSDYFDIESLKIEVGTVTTPYINYIPESSLYLPFYGDGKEYRIIGANIRTPCFKDDIFKLHNDVGHEPLGINDLIVVDGFLRVSMSFEASKVITMMAIPHASMKNVGIDVATAGGLHIHGVAFYKNGTRIDAQDVIIDEGSFWFGGLFLI